MFVDGRSMIHSLSLTYSPTGVGKRISQVSFVDNNSKNPRIEVSKMNDVDSDVENKERRNESNHSFVLTQSVV